MSKKRRTRSKRILIVLGCLAALLSIAAIAFASNSGNDASRSSGAVATGGATSVGESTCGTYAAKFKLHGVDCDTAQAILSLLVDTRHQTLTLAWEGHRVTWTCESPPHSPTYRIRCQRKSRYFISEVT